MRRLILAAWSTAVVLTACSDQTRESPTEPATAPGAAAKDKCTAQRFPHSTVVHQIKDVFPPGMRGQAVSRSAAIKNDWDKCQPDPARQGVLDFIEAMHSDEQAGRLVGTEAQRNTLIITLLTGVELLDLPISLGTDVGIGFFDPNSDEPLLVKTASGQALAEVPARAFTVFTVIVVSRKSDDTELTDFDGDQFPPFYDYTAINSLGTHTFDDELTAIIAFCFVDGVEYPNSVAVGHNPVEGAPGFPFEILDPIDLRPDLRAQLDCSGANNELGSLGNGLWGLANGSWGTAGHHLRSIAKAIFLPTPLRAAAVVAVGPISTKTRSFSPFGVVEVTEAEPEQPLSLNVATVEKLPGGTQRFTVLSGDPGPYIWSVNGVDGGNATFGMIAVATDSPNSADYTAPGTVPTPATFQVCARRQANPLNTACASVTIQPVPSSGADIIVFNDLNMFDNTFGAVDLENLQLYANLVTYTGSGPRATQTRVLVHRGHSVRCFEPTGNQECSPSSWSTFENTMRNAGSGFTVDDVDDATAPLTSIAANVKVVILALPMTPYSTAEINSLKEFAGQGGRVIFVGEWDEFYGVGISVQNDFLTKMGAVMRNTGGAIHCGVRTVIPASSLRSHQVTAGVDQLSIACASVVAPGPNDYPLFYDATTGTQVLGAVAKIDLTPLPNLKIATPGRMMGNGAPPRPANVAADIEVFSWGSRPRE